MAGNAKFEELRRATNPLFNDRKLKLGTFCTNLSGGCAITTMPGTLDITWPNTLRLAQIADQMEFEALVPVGRWKGFGGETNFNGAGFECFSWAAGMAASTKYPAVFATSHVPMYHPALAAKQATVIDHISNGRHAINIVGGWNQGELDMFGAHMQDHEGRYAMAAEWIEIMIGLWTCEDEFTYEGKYYQIKKGALAPKPVQRPYPAIMNAGGSEQGQHFSAKYSDIAFIQFDKHDLDFVRSKVEKYRRLAREEYGREIQIWSFGHVVQRDTEKEAKGFPALLRAREGRLGCRGKSDGAARYWFVGGRGFQKASGAFHGRMGRVSAGRYQGAGRRGTGQFVKGWNRRCAFVVAALRRGHVDVRA